MYVVCTVYRTVFIMSAAVSWAGMGIRMRIKDYHLVSGTWIVDPAWALGATAGGVDTPSRCPQAGGTQLLCLRKGRACAFRRHD